MNKKKLVGIILASAAATAFAAANAVAANQACGVGSRTFPASGTTDTVFASCRHTSAGRGPGEATFVARNQGGTKTLSASMAAFSGDISATIVGLGLFGDPIVGCSATATPGTPASVTCNGARSWRATFSYFE